MILRILGSPVRGRVRHRAADSCATVWSWVFYAPVSYLAPLRCGFHTIAMPSYSIASARTEAKQTKAG